MGLIGKVWDGFERAERRRLGAFLGAVLGLHLLGWGALLVAGAGHPAFIALGGLAYTFGLRHAFDADHISAIDNTTRKLLQEGRKPMGAGFFFSLGHSTVVLLIGALLGLAVKAVVGSVVGNGGQLRSLGGLIGTSVSGVFLILIGILNLIILLDIIRLYRRLQVGGYDQRALERELVAGGVMSRLFSRVFKLVTESWQMYPIGFLFGLGFDTASEVALLAISAGAAAQRIPFLAVIALPIIFAAGMSLMDTADGAFMAKAYSWAFSNPIRKVFYNLAVTSLSVFVALFVGLMEVAQLLIQIVRPQSGLLVAIGSFNLVGSAGIVIVGAFALTWVVAFTFFKLGRVEERWAAKVSGQ